MMKICPSCGTVLDERLVNAIVDPTQEESCPKQDERDRARAKFVEANPGLPEDGWE